MSGGFHHLRSVAVASALVVAVVTTGSATAAPGQPDPLGTEATTTAVLATGDQGETSDTLVSTRTGPDPTGRPVPPTSQRVIDSAIWLWLLLLLFVAFAAVAVRWRDARDTVPLVDLDAVGGRGNPPAPRDEANADDG